MAAFINPCCEDVGNLAILPEDQRADRADIVVRRCQVCRNRHIEVSVEPGVIGLSGAPTGG